MSNFASNDNMTALFTAAGEKIGERAKIFPGSRAEWDALPLSEKIKYDYVAFAGDSQSGIVDDVPTEDSENLVKSGGVFDAIKNVSDDVDGISDEIANEIATRVKVSGHNIGKITNPSKTGLTGLDFTVNSDGSVKVNGTSTAAWSFIMNKAMLLKAGSYIISSGIGANPNLYVQVTNESQSTNIANTANSAEKTFTLNVDTIVVYRIFYLSGQTFNNVVVKPMIRLATDESADYEPYSMTNQEITPYVQAISNPNLLDNPWFTVNQRGVSGAITFDEGRNDGYFVDRWEVTKNTATVNNDSTITLSYASDASKVLWQYKERDFADSIVGKKLTMTVLFSDGTLQSGTITVPSRTSTVQTISFGYWNNTNFQFIVRGTSTEESALKDQIIRIIPRQNNITIKAVKLELGSVSTLAMDTAPNYATELLKCQRYFIRYKAVCDCAIGFERTTAQAQLDFFLPVPMCTTPTITYGGVVKVSGLGHESNSGIDVTSLEFNVINQNVIKAFANVASGLTAGNLCFLHLRPTGYVDISADL